MLINYLIISRMMETHIICNILLGGKCPKSGTLVKPLFIIRL